MKTQTKTRWALPLISAMTGLLLSGMATFGAATTGLLIGNSAFSVTAGGVNAGSVNLVTNWTIVPPGPAGRQTVIESLCLSSSSNSAQLGFWVPVATAVCSEVDTNTGWTNIVVSGTNGAWAVGDLLVFWSRTNSSWQAFVSRGATTNYGSVGWTNVISVVTNGASGGFSATPRAGDMVYRMSRQLEIDLTADGGATGKTNTLGGLQSAWIGPGLGGALAVGAPGQPLLITLRGGQIGSAAFSTTNRVWIASGSYR
jgi:hypothetical protein